MKTATKILARVYELEKSKAEAENWLSQAITNAREVKKVTGYQPLEQMTTAQEAINNIVNEIATLKWILT